MLNDFNCLTLNSLNVTPGDLRLPKPGGGIMTMGKGNWNGIKRHTNEKVLEMIFSLKKAMSSSQGKDDFW